MPYVAENSVLPRYIHRTNRKMFKEAGAVFCSRFSLFWATALHRVGHTVIVDCDCSKLTLQDRQRFLGTHTENPESSDLDLQQSATEGIGAKLAMFPFCFIYHNQPMNGERITLIIGMSLVMFASFIGGVYGIFEIGVPLIEKGGIAVVFGLGVVLLNIVILWTWVPYLWYCHIAKTLREARAEREDRTNYK